MYLVAIERHINMIERLQTVKLLRYNYFNMLTILSWRTDNLHSEGPIVGVEGKILVGI